LGAGVAACYRGPYPYEDGDDETKEMVKKWLNFNAKYRFTLIQPLVHLRRPNMQSWDGWLNANPRKIGGGDEVGIAMIFNPTDSVLEDERLEMDLYYTGLDGDCVVYINEEDEGTTYSMKKRSYKISLTLTLEPKSIYTLRIVSAA